MDGGLQKHKAHSNILLIDELEKQKGQSLFVLASMWRIKFFHVYGIFQERAKAQISK